MCTESELLYQVQLIEKQMELLQQISDERKDCLNEIEYEMRKFRPKQTRGDLIEAIDDITARFAINL